MLRLHALIHCAQWVAVHESHRAPVCAITLSPAPSPPTGALSVSRREKIISSISLSVRAERRPVSLVQVKRRDTRLLLLPFAFHAGFLSVIASVAVSNMFFIWDLLLASWPSSSL